MNQIEITFILIFLLIFFISIPIFCIFNNDCCYCCSLIHNKIKKCFRKKSINIYDEII